MHYEDRVRALREDHDLSQASVADELHVAQTTYSDYENGKLRIPVDVLISLAQFYNVDMNYICGISADKKRFPKK